MCILAWATLAAALLVVLWAAVSGTTSSGEPLAAVIAVPGPALIYAGSAHRAAMNAVPLLVLAMALLGARRCSSS